ncbi:DNA-binding transcriptional regulator, PucR family [Nonomuraea solani]|uniref:DNA-binding transcriptional regulator, PucR family n=1 Tax=Nonomuraea solani TaxID=1144553 RepID=A0A1H6EWP8_9ACTN|nr:helix-turn-helix domain-containing protein [Nonomuraea solani]SEH02278.1 DNA-binding transcriptional regulator, PucR family [Nonomuraea solani]
MLSELQTIVDSVASRVGRPALIEDHRQRVVAYSEQVEPMDEVRRLSILRRQTTPEVIAFFRKVGIMQAREPIRTPACAELRMLPRICVPIRHGDLLLGFVWAIDADESMTDEEIAAVSTVTFDLALALYRENLAGELASQRETEAIRLLLADERDARRHGAMTLREGGLLAGDDVPTTAVVARLIPHPDAQLDDLARIALEQALIASRRRTGPREAVHLVRYDHGVLLVQDRQGTTASRAAAEHLNDVLETTIRGLSSVAGAVVGVGRPRADLSEVRLSYDEAATAAQVAVRLPAVGPVANWSQLGIYRVLSQLSSEVLGDAGVHPGLEKLIEDPANRPLLETLETYLDLAGNAHATAVQLNLHRTSVYYRLQRVEQLAGTDLRNGNERLSLHMALKLARLTGA